MRISPRTLLWWALAAAIALALVWQAVPIADATSRTARLPVSGWRLSSRDIPLTATEASIFGHAHVVKRLYQISGQRVVLTAIDGTRERHAVHDPQYCFRGAGWKIRDGRDHPVPGGVARQIHLVRGADHAEALYWISDAQVRHASVARAWIQSTFRRLTFGRSGGEPVLFILQPVAGESVDWTRLVSDCPDLFQI
ncbi:MAG: exosortase-associated EpsI family protein [Verrucomicrobiales bacterium]|nr:exosortase-associated EpsI family protein [Verrucomicrobiales bacterium]